MVKRMIFLFLMVALLFSLSVKSLAQEKNEVPKKVVKLVEKAADDIKAQKLDKAAEKLAEAKELAPDYAPLYVQLSILSQQTQNLDEALAHMTKAYELDPASDAVNNHLAFLILKIAQKKNAEHDMPGTLALYEKFVELPGISAKMSAQFVQVSYTLAGNYLSVNKPDQVIRHAAALLSTPGIETYKQQHLFAYFMLGSAYGQKEDIVNSISNLKNFLELNTDNLAPAQFVSLANYLIASNLFSELEKEVEGLKKEDLEGIKKAAQARTEMLAYLNDALVADSANKDARFALARYHYYCLDHDSALKLIDELLAVEPGNSDYLQVKDIVSKAREAQKKK